MNAFRTSFIAMIWLLSLLAHSVAFAQGRDNYAEARQKFAKIRPASLDQATRISGITPSDVALVLAHLQSRGQ